MLPLHGEQRLSLSVMMLHHNPQHINAVYVLRSVVEYYVSFGTTVNICALDLSKAFDKMNHHGLFVKLMDKNIPINLLMLFEHWFSVGVTCVKWGSIVSRFIGLLSGIRQGGYYHLTFLQYISIVLSRKLVTVILVAI